MRHTGILLQLTLLSLSVFLLSACNDYSSHHIQNGQVIDIDGQMFSDCPYDPCETMRIERESGLDSLVLNFPRGGTQTDVRLYAAHDDVELKHVSHLYGLGGSLALDITGMKDGNYRAEYSSCSYGGSLNLELITKK